jgi:hypothetical protein
VPGGGAGPAEGEAIVVPGSQPMTGDTAGAEDVLRRAREPGWTVVSMENDWATVFGEP